MHGLTPIAHASPPCAPGPAVLYYPQGPRLPLLSPPVTASRERMVAAPPMLIHPGAVDSCGLRGFSRPDAPPPAVPPPGPLGMKKERRSPRRPFPVKICENSRPPSRRPCPLSLDIPGFSHVLPSCPALSRLSQLSCLFTAGRIVPPVSLSAWWWISFF